MDAVETVMRRDGYAALSVRSIAQCAELNYQLVFYYFGTLDGLLLATYRRRTERMLGEIEEALASERPYHAIWEASSDPVEAALSLEYMALSNHNAAIRSESIEHVERTLAITIARLAAPPQPAGGGSGPISPVAASMIIAMLGNSIGFQAAQGIIGPGLQDAKELVVRWLDWFEPSAANSAG